MAKWWCDYGGWWCGCGGFNVLFRRLQGLFTVKMLCEDGENAVRKLRNCGVFAACTCLVSCILVAKVAKWWCDCSGWWCGCGGFRVWFLYDLVADMAFGNL